MSDYSAPVALPQVGLTRTAGASPIPARGLRRGVVAFQEAIAPKLIKIATQGTSSLRLCPR